MKARSDMPHGLFGCGKIGSDGEAVQCGLIGSEKKGAKAGLKKTVLCAALASAMGLAGSASADTFVFNFNGLFTMLDSGGALVTNTANSPDTPESTFWYGKRTLMTGTIIYDDATGLGSATINDFHFFGVTNSYLAHAHDVTLRAVGDGNGGNGPLVLANMGFDWNGTNGIPVSLVLDASGMLANMDTMAVGGSIGCSNEATMVGSPADPAGAPCATSGGATAANDASAQEVKKGVLAFDGHMGTLPVVSTTWNTTTIPGSVNTNPPQGSPIGSNVSGTTPVVADTIGGSPMIAGPFVGFNANFDFTQLTLVSVTPGSDTTPAAFSFNAVTGQNTGATVESNTVTITGIDNTHTPISITGGEYRIDGGAYTNAVGSIRNNQTVQVRQTTSASNNTQTDAVLAVGTVSSTFSTTTAAGQFVADTTPDGFAFTARTDVAPSSAVVSNEVTIAGINTATPISVTGGSYSIDGGAATTAPGTINNNQKVTLSHTARDGFSQTGTTTLTVGDMTATFSSTTVAVDATPDGFGFIDQTGVSLNATIESTPITVAGINAAVPISITGGEYSINGGAYTNVQGTVSNGQTVTVRHTSSASNSSTVDTVLTIGGVSDTFTSTTLAAGAKKFTGRFTMLNARGDFVGDDIGVTGTWDGTFNTASNGTNFNMTLASPNPFFGVPWFAHDIRVFGPGSYTVNTACTVAELTAGSTCAAAGTPLSFTVGDGQVGAHVLFDYGSTSNIDVVQVWNTDGTPALTKIGPGKEAGSFTHAMTDVNTDGIAGLPMVDGPFGGFNANFDLKFGSYDVATSTAGAAIVSLEQKSLAELANTAGMPSGLVFNNGFVSFKVQGVPVGGSATVTLTLPSIAAGSVAYWVGPNGFTPVPDAVIDYAAKTVTFTVTDGGFGDADGEANGEIDDPVGLGDPPPAAPVLADSGGGGGGCAVNPKAGFDPVLPGLLLTALGYLGWRRRRN